MIVPMKKVWLLTLKSTRDVTLQALRKLGVVEVVSETIAESADRLALINQLGELDRAINILDAREVEPEAIAADVDTAAVSAKGLELVAASEELERENDALNKERAAVEPWGDYQPEMIAELAEKGVYVYLCECPVEQRLMLAEAEELADAAIADVTDPAEAKRSGLSRFAVISQKPLSENLLPLVTPAERSLGELDRARKDWQDRRTALDEEMDKLSVSLEALKIERTRRQSELALLTARDGLTDCGEIVALRGFIPAKSVDKLREASQIAGWGLSLSDPEPGENVPVLLEPPKWVRPVLPLFKFLGIAPGYEEFDMSPGMLIFFSIFFSMIINDAGYAVLMLAGSIAAMIALRKNPKAVLPCKLALILSGCATIWGACNGSYFGVIVSPLEFFAAGKNQTSHLQLVCFILALAHLSLGHCWRLVNASSVREVIGQLGWIPILVLDFMVVCSLLVFPGKPIPAWSLWCGGVGLAMVLAGAVDWRDVGAICNFPFDLLGTFTDTLSYVRLFAVGMSGSYMAMSFNSMGMDLWNSSPWLIPVAILVILFGHALNVALAFMGVLVHGVRLNTLEFSNHAGIRWGGSEFRPLKESD